MISASILNGDLAELAGIADTVAASGAEALHFDVMDGHFVDNLSFGLPVLTSLRPRTRLLIDVHLMITEPLHFAERFLRAGADLLSFHLESDSDTVQTLDLIHSYHVPAGIAVSPDTPLSELYPYLPYLQQDDFILLMTVYPGLGGQKFMERILPKISELSAYIKQRNLSLHIEVDGGINAETGAMCRKAGADYLVAGSYLLLNDNPAEAVRCLNTPLV